MIAAPIPCPTDNCSMFNPIGDLVHCPKKVVSSFVRIERTKERRNLSREVLTSPFYHAIKLRFVGGEREISVFKACVSGDFRGGIPSLIKSGSQVTGDA